MRAATALLLLHSILFAGFASAQTAAATSDINAQIRKEAMENSQIMRTVSFFTDVYGPRLTGSPNHKAAAEWAAKQMTAWGMENAALEPWISVIRAGSMSEPPVSSPRRCAIRSFLKYWLGPPGTE
jgi:hypothetical protein